MGRSPALPTLLHSSTRSPINKAEGYGYLRAVQKTILDAWSPRRDERDPVIKTNTGGGKTIAGLLIFQA